MKWALVLALTATLAVGGRGVTPAVAPVPSAPARAPFLATVVDSVPAADAVLSSSQPDASVAQVNPATSGWVWPTDPPRTVVHPFDPPATTWGSGHRGVDLAAVIGGSIRAPADGQVTLAGMVAGHPVVVIAHPGGLRSTFEPVSATVPVGARVRSGEVIGLLSAHAGHCVPAACVHWGVLRGEVYLDPMALIAGRVVLLPLR